MIINQQRIQLRTVIRTRRNALSPQEQADAAQALFKKLICHPKILQAKRLSIYLARDGELDGAPFINWCWQQNKEIYLPVVHPFSTGHLLFLQYQENTKMRMSSFGINEPKLDVRLVQPTKGIDVMLTPLVAFDHAGNRLGMGGGYYDRTLAQWYQQHAQAQQQQASKPYPIGIAHDCQQLPSLPIQPWDIPLPEIITPSQHIVSAKAHGQG